MGTAVRVSPNNIMGDWGYVEAWASGTSVAPSGWVMAGTAGSVAQETTTIKYGTKSMKIISGGSDSYKATYAVSNYSDYADRTVKFGMWVYASDASKARIYIYDGTTTTNSSYHSGGGDWEFLEVEAQVGSSNSELTFGCEVQSATITAYFDGGVAIEGDTIFTELSSNVERWRPSIKYASSKFAIARKDGVVIPDVAFREKTITLSGNVTGTTATTARTSFDTILKALNQGKKDLYLYDDRLVKAFLTSHKHDYLASLRMIKFTLKFVAPEPFMRYISKLRDKQTISSSPTSYNFEYNGNVSSFPVITFSPSGNDMTACTLENLTTGETLTFDATVSDGNDLVIDCEKLTVQNNAVDAIGDFSGDFMKLIPGTNYMKFTGSDTVIKIDWWDKWV